MLIFCIALFKCIDKKFSFTPTSNINSETRLRLHSSKWPHIIPILYSLNCPLVDFTNGIKMLKLTYRALNGQAPVCLAHLLLKHTAACTLQLQAQNLLVVLYTRLKTWGKGRVFHTLAPAFLNSLPIQLHLVDSKDSFKKQIKNVFVQPSFLLTAF